MQVSRWATAAGGDAAYVVVGGKLRVNITFHLTRTDMLAVKFFPTGVVSGKRVCRTGGTGRKRRPEGTESSGTLSRHTQRTTILCLEF
jgi:hypothetical protein